MSTQASEHSFVLESIPAVLTIREIIQMSKTSRWTVYTAIANGHLKTYKRGKRRFATGPDFIRWATSSYLPEASQ